jgi:hypothetical protein
MLEQGHFVVPDWARAFDGFMVERLILILVEDELQFLHHPRVTHPSD